MLFKTLLSYCVLLLSVSMGALAQDDVRQLRLIFAGDIMGHGPQIKSAEEIEDYKYDYRRCFRYVRPILEMADLAIGNLELTLPGEPPYQGYPYFRSPDELADALKYAGFDLLVTANNHSNDAGRTGVIQTVTTLQEKNFFQTGTFRSTAERRLHYPLIVYRKGFKIAFLNYTYGVGRLTNYDPKLVNEIDPSLIESDLRVARQLEPDFIIVYMHWGWEYRTKENPRQRKLAGQLFEWGADLVVGAHPHVVQPVYSSMQEDKKVLVAYSLGNFVSNQLKPKTDGGILLDVTLIKKGKGKARLHQYGYIPVWRYRHQTRDGHTRYFVLPISHCENPLDSPIDLPAEDRRKMDRYARFIREHMADSGCPEVSF